MKQASLIQYPGLPPPSPLHVHSLNLSALRTTRPWSASNNLGNKASGLLTTETVLVKLKITSWPQLCPQLQTQKSEPTPRTTPL